MMKFKFAAKEVMVEMVESIKTMTISGMKKVKSFFTKQRIVSIFRALQFEATKMLCTLIAPIPKILMWVMRISLIALIPCIVIKSLSAFTTIAIMGFVLSALFYLCFTFVIRVFEKMMSSYSKEKAETEKRFLEELDKKHEELKALI